MKRPAALLALLLLPFLSPAREYWQQRVDTRISVRLDPARHQLYATEQFTYQNNSPDTLRLIYIHLWPNAYKNDRTAFAEQKYEQGDTRFYYSKSRGFIDSLDFRVDDREVSLDYLPNNPDIGRINLNEPLAPGRTITVSTPFRVQVPLVFSRMGRNGNAYFISQWFPKPAVYDRTGWHFMPYLDQGEFYSEYGNYDVDVTLPANYRLLATGNCTDASENAWLDSLARAPFPPETAAPQPAKPATELKTVHFHEDRVHDFAWFADIRWIVRKDTVRVPGLSTDVVTYAAFLPEHRKQWIKGNDYLRDAVNYYSAHVGSYPYRTIKAVDGDMDAGAAMEYPTITIIDKKSLPALKTSIVHEAGHNWFYGILGSNERRFPWIDEGMNSYYEQRTMRAADSTSRADKLISNFSQYIYYEGVADHTDQALNLPATEYTERNYGGDVYFKTPLMLTWLAAYMGEREFERAMHDYFDTWKFRHPQPDDIREVFRRNSSKPVDWFFDGALATDQKVDFKLDQVRREGDSLQVRLRNRSGFAAPAGLVFIGDTADTEAMYTLPFSGDTTFRIKTPRDWHKLTIDRHIPELKIANSTYRRYGIPHRSGPSVGLIAGFNRNERERLWIAPSVGFNAYDGFGVGLLLHNLTVPETQFRFALAPMYGTRSGSFNMAGSVGYFWHPNKAFQEISFQVDGKSFHYARSFTDDNQLARFYKIAPTLRFEFRESALSDRTRELTLQFIGIREEHFNYFAQPDGGFSVSTPHQDNYFFQARYRHENALTLNPFQYQGTFQAGQGFLKASVEGRLRIDYEKKGQALTVRGYAGKFISLVDDSRQVSRYWLNSTFTGLNDYLYEDTYLGRSELTGFWSHQISEREGGLKVPTSELLNPIGRSDNWLGALNVETTLPVIPLRLFADASFRPVSNNQNSVLFDAGVSLHLFRNAINIYAPFLLSSDLKDFQNYRYPTNKFFRSIYFTVNLSSINWLKAASSVISLGTGR